MGQPLRHLFVFTLVLLLSIAERAKAGEGMWDFTNLPVGILQEKYGYQLTDACASHLMASSLRFPNGSASFVSPNGLVITNHHVGFSSIAKLSSAQNDYVKNGFMAKTNGEEIQVPGLELSRLEKIDDVTKEVQASVTEGMSEEEAAAARKAKIANLEKAGKGEDPNRSCEVVTLYSGGKYHLYTYRVYRDVRLVFAPEFQAAFFGGDPDNFEFPRFALDFALFRVYENGKPAQIKSYLKVKPDGAQEKDLLFASGHPGSTGRIQTIAALEFLREHQVPYMTRALQAQEVALQQYSFRSPEAARQARDPLFSVQNSRKVFLGREQGLRSQSFFQRKYAAETDLIAYARVTPGLEGHATAWEQIRKAREWYGDYFLVTNLFESGHAFNSQLFRWARDLVRIAEETSKPNAERLEEYRDSNLPTLKNRLLASVPLYPELEIVQLTTSLTLAINQLPQGDNLRPILESILQGKTPEDRAREFVSGSRLASAEERKRLLEGGALAIGQSYDSMIMLAREVDNVSRLLRKKYDANVKEVELQAYAKIAAVMFHKFGTSRPPDATFTLRLTYGEVLGYPDYGSTVAPITNVAGLYEKSKERQNQPPWDLPNSWVANSGQVNKNTPFNFAVTLDTIGGNSGSPIVDKDMNLVGLVFDGNRHSPMTFFDYDDSRRRTLGVHAGVIIESLRNVYGAGHLAEELLGRR